MDQNLDLSGETWVECGPEGVVRCVGNPKKRFSEDYIRILRAIRFAARLNFTLDRATRMAIRDMAPSLNYTAIERIRDELMLMFNSKSAGDSARLLYSEGIFAVVLPDIECMLSHPGTCKRFHLGTLDVHALMTLDDFTKGTSFTAEENFAAFIHDIGKPMARRSRNIEGDPQESTYINHAFFGQKIAQRLCERLKFSNAQTDHISRVVGSHMVLHELGQKKNFQGSDARKFLERYGDIKDILFALANADCCDLVPDILRETSEYLTRMRVIVDTQKPIQKPIITGKEIMDALEITGPEVGKIKTEIFEEYQVKQGITDRGELMKILLTMMQRRWGNEA